MFVYDFNRLDGAIRKALQKSLSPDAWKWLSDQADTIRTRTDDRKFNATFVAMPRKTGKHPLHAVEGQASGLGQIRKGLDIAHWTADRLARVWLLMQLDHEPKAKYISTVENLFLNGEMGELVALYSALPVLAYPDAWKKRCAEGIRSNIGQVLEAIMCRNPFPSEQLDEPAWNQLILKAIFTEKPILDIVGLRERRNQALARSLCDYAHERWAAGRDVNPLLWICVAPFVDESNISDVRRIFSSRNPLEKEAAALACHESNFPGAHALLETDPHITVDIKNGKVSWQGIAKKLQVA